MRFTSVIFTPDTYLGVTEGEVYDSPSEAMTAAIITSKKNAWASVPAVLLTPCSKTGRVVFGFALADGMFVGDCTIVRKQLSAEDAKIVVDQGVESCLNPSHKATIDAMRVRFGINVPIPETPPRVELHPGDSVIVMGVRGLPRLTDCHEYTEEEVTKATFVFSIYTVE